MSGIGYRAALLSFLEDERLSKAQRIVGALLILRGNGRRRFISTRRPIDWEHFASRTGYSEKAAKAAYADLIALGWLEERTDNGGVRYQMPTDAYERIKLREQEFQAKIRGARSDPAPEQRAA